MSCNPFTSGSFLVEEETVDLLVQVVAVAVRLRGFGGVDLADAQLGAVEQVAAVGRQGHAALIVGHRFGQGQPALVPDPDERPEPTAIPGFPLLPGYTTPLEVERSAVPESHIVLREGLRVIAADGDDLGQFGAAVIVNTRLAGLILRGDENLFVAYEWLDHLDDDAGELTLTVGRAELAPFEEGEADDDEEA